MAFCGGGSRWIPDHTSGRVCTNRDGGEIAAIRGDVVMALPAVTHVARVSGEQDRSLELPSPAARQQFSIADGVAGLWWTGRGSSDAGEKGLRRGDVIVRAGDREVAGASDVDAAVSDWKKAGRQSIPLAVNRGGRTIFVPIKIEG